MQQRSADGNAAIDLSVVRPAAGERAAGSLPDRIYSSVLAAILRGDFSASGKLPTEWDLARQFAVSRPTIREALARLRSDGVIDSRRGSGSHLVSASGLPTATVPPIKSMADVEHYYAYRACLEAGAAAMAAEYRSAADLGAMRAALNSLAAATKGGGFGIEEDVQFHLAIARASQNPFFVAEIETSVTPIRQIMELARSMNDTKAEERVRATHLEHLAVLNAIERRSPREAAEAIREHVVAAKRRIFESTPLP